MTTERVPIELTNVTRTFGDVTALDGLDLRVESEEVYGFLGPNGAGKTTTIGLLINFLRPSAGRVRVFGLNPRNDEVAVKARTGILPEGFTPYPGLTGREHLTLACRLRDEHDPGAYLERVGLSDSADQKAGEYSRGMTKRLGLAMALVGSPKLLVLDEPIAGLDPDGAARVKEIIEAENENGTTVFFSSHQLAHVNAICDRVGIVTDGRTVAEVSIEEFRASVDSGPTLTIVPETPPTRVPEWFDDSTESIIRP